MTKTLRKAMVSTICMLVVAVLSLTGVTYAWFTQGTTANVTGMNIEVSTADGGIQVRTLEGSTKGNWASSLDLDASRSSVKPVSSADGTTFFTVTTDPTDSSKFSVQALSSEAKEAAVITKTIQLTNPGATDITVALNATNSTITSAENTANNNAETGIYQAARVALIVDYADDSDSEDVVYIWAPNDAAYVALVGATEDFDNYLVATEDVSEEVVITAAADCEIVLPANAAMAEDAAKLVTVTIVVWLEGQDNNCTNPNAGGAFDVEIQFEVKQ